MATFTDGVPYDISDKAKKELSKTMKEALMKEVQAPSLIPPLIGGSVKMVDGFEVSSGPVKKEDFKHWPWIEPEIKEWKGVKFVETTTMIPEAQPEASPEDMMAKMQEVLLPVALKAILMHAKRWDLTGSRAIIPGQVEEDRDWDFIVLLKSEGSLFEQVAEANGFMAVPEYDKEAPDAVEALGHDPETARWKGALASGAGVDLITFEDNEPGRAAYERWLTATKVCKELGLKERKHRVMVFRAIRTGKWFPPEEEKALPSTVDKALNDEIPF